MAIQLYKPGNTHTVRGIECELKNFDAYELTDRLNEGWFTDPSGCYAEDEQSPPEKINPIRLAAHDANIEGWESKRIKTLKAELDELES